MCVEGLGARRGDQEDFIQCHKDSRIAGLQGQDTAHCSASNTHAARVAARHTNRIGTKSFVQTISREKTATRSLSLCVGRFARPYRVAAGGRRRCAGLCRA